MELKDWVRAARAHKGMTQARLGDQVGRTKANIAHWESGKVKPSYAQVVQVASITGYPMPDQLGGPPAEELASDSTTSNDPRRLDDIKRQLLADIDMLLPEDTAQFVAAIHARAEEMRRYRLHFLQKTAAPSATRAPAKSSPAPAAAPRPKTIKEKQGA